MFEFIETPVFTRQLIALLDDDEYRALQAALIAHPDAGALIPNTGGVRKIRWGIEGRGKQGGVRVIYYWRTARNRVYFLLMYAKNRQDDLTPEQRAVIRASISQMERE